MACEHQEEVEQVPHHVVVAEEVEPADRDPS